jgi:DNA-directed RNA polymerase subunit beta
LSSKKRIERHSFGKIPSALDMPDLLEVQVLSYDSFLQRDILPAQREKKGLQAVFLNVFPIIDNREEHILEFVEYHIEAPKYSVEECRERGVSFSAPLKARLRLSSRRNLDETAGFDATLETDVYLGNLPLMTEGGTFIINGAERVIVSQLHRSPGVFFGDSIHPNGTRIFSARIIPFRGSWIEFTTDINDILYVYIDRRKRFPVSTLLRAIGYSSDLDILNLFGHVEEVPLSRKDIERFYEKMILEDLFDSETGELVTKKGQMFDEAMLKLLRKHHVKRINFLHTKKKDPIYDIINNTLVKDKSANREEALNQIYQELRAGEPPDLETAERLLNRLFFDEKRYDLGKVGRFRINTKLDLTIPFDHTVLTREDIVAIIKFVLKLKVGQEATDDIDHLGNRRIRTVGEQLANQFSVALSRMARTIKERMNLRETEQVTPQDLVNVRTISSVINTFFGTNQLSQFLDQVNPLTELTHKRRLSALGPGGLTRERAGFEVRDVHYTHYGRLCPIETPEGPNIGLISSLSTYGRINDLGFIESPYRRVRNGRVTKQVEYLTSDDEDKYVIAQANAPISEKGEFLNDQIKCRFKGEFPVCSPQEVNYMDVSPNQIVSVAAALIPFLEHDDANRALMGSNMQRQAVPLLMPEAPIVGTGFEEKTVRDSRALIAAEEDSVVERVTADEIVVRVKGRSKSSGQDLKSYRLKKFVRTNQDTCINQKPSVRKGEAVKAGDVLADGCSTEHGELALGRNVMVAFMPWHGYNFEDSIIVSERMVSEDVFSSIHIEELELQVRETKRGEEELTREIPNVSEEATKDLDENGIVRVGAEVNYGDIIIGKVTPKGEMDLTPEDKLLKAIFGDKAGDVKDASLKAHAGMNGIVIATKLFSRKKKDARTRKEDRQKMEELEEKFKRDVDLLKKARVAELSDLLIGKKAVAVRDKNLEEILVHEGEVFSANTFKKLDLDLVEANYNWTKETETNELIELIFEKCEERLDAVTMDFRNEKHKVMGGDELPSGIVQLAKVYIAKKRKLSVGDKMAGRHGNKGVVGKVVPGEDMPFLPDGTPIDIILNPLGVPSRMNLGQIFETILGWAGKKLGKYYATPVFDGAKMEDIKKELEAAGLDPSGKVQLYDGRTGEPFDQKITVGNIYIMKLSHLVDDKIHARSIGPYSLITQQPLGGKAQFGGQRFGEMEVWALEAYGAAYTLQEILTVKSDDVEGRARTYEAIVKGENLPVPGVPESFNVLINELLGLGLDVKLE